MCHFEDIIYRCSNVCLGKPLKPVPCLTWPYKNLPSFIIADIHAAFMQMWTVWYPRHNSFAKTCQNPLLPLPVSMQCSAFVCKHIVTHCIGCYRLLHGLRCTTRRLPVTRRQEGTACLGEASIVFATTVRWNNKGNNALEELRHVTLI